MAVLWARHRSLPVTGGGLAQWVVAVPLVAIASIGAVVWIFAATNSPKFIGMGLSFDFLLGAVTLCAAALSSATVQIATLVVSRVNELSESNLEWRARLTAPRQIPQAKPRSRPKT